MKTCKDCIHFEVCYVVEVYGEEDDDNENCYQFKNKADFVEALKKQIAMKPIENRFPWAICPSCGGSMWLENVQEHIQNEEYSHCEHCGQKIDWSDT